MKKSVILNLSLAVLTAVLVYGCQTLGVGPSDEELVNATMAEWKAALAAKDMDKLMATFSEDYVSARGTGKDAMLEFMTRAFDEGFMDNVEVNVENAQITIEGDKATFGPIEFESDRGMFALEYTLQKEDGAWLIVSSKRQEQ
jgi:ketosteroid isomerase-like protein